MGKAIGFGTALKKGATALGQIIEISREASEAGEVETTTLDASDRFETYIAGLINPGSVKLKLAYDPSDTNLKAWMAEHEAGGSTTYSIVYPNAVTQTFSAFVKSVGAEIPLKDLMTCDVTLKISGDPGWTT